MSNPIGDESYFDLHITGVGYLNRIREVKVKKGQSFLACDIVALNGPISSPEYRRFDLRVTGEEAKQLVRGCAKALEENMKVLVGFRLGDPWLDTFTYSKGTNAGQLGVSFKARLLLLNWIKVDGILIFKHKPTESDGNPDNETSQALKLQPDPAGPGAPYT
ncbi:STY4534 family ICE replication protein [Pseudomonas sp. B15(2017)]|uniref:STY4534 family ICE replication protein n=1 Tax=Pseudomonas sp. B15(2017) TaxID=1981744 RepID=UPI000A1D7A30|nr:STY4534 family ICE replication protein [Pseudomonas sp. B15(2017)]